MIRYNIKITIKKISKSEIKIGIEAPNDVVICREEVV
ncbi:MAG: carbon storage regulator [Planctomycetota bacterium]